VNVFLVPKLEVGYGVVADLSDEGVVVCGTLTEKFFGQTVMTGIPSYITHRLSYILHIKLSYNSDVIFAKCHLPCATYACSLPLLSCIRIHCSAFPWKKPQNNFFIPRKVYLTGQKTREAFGSTWKLLQNCQLTGKNFWRYFWR
jgi:hypothetical protein